MSSKRAPHEGQVPQWLTAAEVAQRLGVSERAIQRRCKAGKLPARLAPTPTGQQWEIDGAALDSADRNDRDDTSDTNDRNDTQAATEATPTTQRTTGTTQETTETTRKVATAPTLPTKAATTGTTPTTQGDDTNDTRAEVAQLRAERDAAQAEAQRERELSAFLKLQIEEANRNAAELRATVRELLKQRALPAPNVAMQSTTTATGSTPRRDTQESPPEGVGEQQVSNAATNSTEGKEARQRATNAQQRPTPAQARRAAVRAFVLSFFNSQQEPK